VRTLLRRVAWKNGDSIGTTVLFLCVSAQTAALQKPTLHQRKPEFAAPSHPTHKDPPMTARSVYIEKMKLQLDELNASMTKLEGNAKVAKAEARAKYQEEMEKLKHQSDLAVAKLEEVKASGEDTWETMVAEMEKVREAFAHSFNYFKSQI
jgi:hypothetical protein